jgi:hypothetical protein
VSGKSTIASTFQRLYEPAFGLIHGFESLGQRLEAAFARIVMEKAPESHMIMLSWMSVSCKIVGTLLGQALRDLSRFRRRGRKIIVLALPDYHLLLPGIEYWIEDYSTSIPVRVCAFPISLTYL